MATDVKKLIAQALALPEKSRWKLVDALLATMEGPEDPDAEKLWKKEVEWRVKLDKQGKLKTIPFEKVLAELKSLRAK